MLKTGYFGCGQPVAGDHVSTVLYQACGGVLRTGRYSVSSVLQGSRHRGRPSSRLRRAFSHCVVYHSYRNQQIRRRLPPLSGYQCTYNWGLEARGRYRSRGHDPKKLRGYPSPKMAYYNIWIHVTVKPRFMVFFKNYD